MAIEKEYGKFVPTCDCCEKTLPPQDTFEDAKDAMKEAGWKYYLREGTNLCEDCQED